MTFVKTDVSGAISAHAAVKQNVHGVGANDIADVADISTHAAVSTNVHGVGANDIADVADISTHAAVSTNVHGTGAGNVIVGDDELSALVNTSSGNYTGNDSVNRAIAHGLGATPSLIIITMTQTGSLYTIIIIPPSTILFSGANTTIGQYTVTVADATNFYVGNSGQYARSGNGNTFVYYWTVFK